MKIWKLVSVAARTPKEVSKCLREGYEPFAVTQELGGDRIWFKKEDGSEVPSKQGQRKPRRSSKLNLTAKGEVSNRPGDSES